MPAKKKGSAARRMRLERPLVLAATLAADSAASAGGAAALGVGVGVRNLATFWALAALSALAAWRLLPGASPCAWAALAVAIYLAAFAALELLYFFGGVGVWDENERVAASYQWFDVYLPAGSSVTGDGGRVEADLTEAYFGRHGWGAAPDVAMRDKYDEFFDLLGLRSGQVVLDVGCGYGQWMLYLRSRGVEAVGLTIAPAQVEFARDKTGLDVRLQDVRELPADFDGRFDAVTLLGCMEHMTKSSWPRGRCQDTFRGVLANARRALKPGPAGRVLVAALTFPRDQRPSLGDWARLYLLERHYSGRYPGEGDLPAQAAAAGLRLEHESDHTEDYRWISMRSPDHFGNFEVAWTPRRAAYVPFMFLTDPFAAHKWLYHATGTWMWHLGGTSREPVADRPAPCRLKWNLFSRGEGSERSSPPQTRAKA